MTKEEAQEYAKTMTYSDAIYNLMKAKSIPYRKATFIKIDELLKALEQESKITSETIQNILDYLANNNSRWSELRWEDKEGKGFETDQGYFIEGLKGLRDYLKESEG